MNLMRGIIGALIVYPIWLYLLYKILVIVEATELMWFLFYIYVPAAFIVAAVTLALNKTEVK